MIGQWVDMAFLFIMTCILLGILCIVGYYWMGIRIIMRVSVAIVTQNIHIAFHIYGNASFTSTTQHNYMGTLCNKNQKLNLCVGCLAVLSHWGRDTMAVIFQTTFFKCIFSNRNLWISLNISMKYVPKVRIDNIPALVQIMAWRRPGDTPLSKPMMNSLLKHMCVTRPQWVNCSQY